MKNKSIISSFVKKVLNVNSYKIYSQDYILEEEKEFFTNKYMGLSKNDYKYKKGNIPILISAPHSVKQIRNDQLKPADIYTGAIIKTLGKTTNAHIIYKTRASGDENHTTKKTAYRNEIEKIVKKHNIKVIIDLHGMSMERKSDIDIGTGSSKNKNLLGKDYILHIVRNSLKNLNCSENKYFHGGKDVTLSSYCSQVLGVPTLQLEINRKYRTKESRNFSHLVDELSKMINDLNNELKK